LRGRDYQWSFIVIIILLLLLDGLKERTDERRIIERSARAADNLDLTINQPNEQFGTATATQGAHRFNTNELWYKVAKFPLQRRHRFYVWSSDQQNIFTGSAPGVDRNPYFANSFLVGFKPFDTESIWEPLATLALRKSYILDHRLYGSYMTDIWQNSRQAYGYTRGDCEDHALILADWLIAMGNDARVALGKYKGGGHAWVVLFLDGKEYILEATSKRRPKGIGDFLIAKLATDYKPLYQFNRKQFWVNTGSIHTTRYRDKKWQLSSTFSRDFPFAKPQLISN